MRHAAIIGLFSCGALPVGAGASTTLDNQTLRVELDGHGRLAHLYDRTSKTECLHPDRTSYLVQLNRYHAFLRVRVGGQVATSNSVVERLLFGDATATKETMNDRPVVTFAGFVGTQMNANLDTSAKANDGLEA